MNTIDYNRWKTASEAQVGPIVKFFGQKCLGLKKGALVYQFDTLLHTGERMLLYALFEEDGSRSLLTHTCPLLEEEV